MRRAVSLLAGLLLCLALWGCAASRGYPAEEDPVWGVRMWAEEVSPEGLVLVISHQDEAVYAGPLEYALGCTLERLEKDTWVEVEGAPKKFAALGVILPSGETRRGELRWKDFLSGGWPDTPAPETLPPGEYRFGQGFCPLGEPDNARTYYARFRVG